MAPALLAEIFGDVPLDFPVHFGRSLPLGAHRSGAVGITLFGRVHFLSSTLDWSAADRLILLRHEAEHVRQQRASPFLFYPRYLLGWLRGIISGSAATASERGIAGRSALRYRMRQAYLAIPAERAAYAAEHRARGLMNTGS